MIDPFLICAQANLAGNQRFRMDSAGTITLTEAIRGKDGSAAAPTYTFSSLTTAGLSLISAAQNRIGLSVSSTYVIDMTSSRVSFDNAPIWLLNGSTSAPAIANNVDNESDTPR